jgi:tRNA nucleotidyltransferase/poly(A) polymerase
MSDNQSDVFFNQKESILKSFYDDPIRMFRFLHATNKRALEISDEMRDMLPIAVKSAQAFFYNPDYSSKINSWMYKMLCQEQSEKNFKLLLSSGLLSCLFPVINELVKNNFFEKWIIHELNFPSHKLSLNYVYAMFILGSCLSSNTIGSTITDNIIQQINEAIVNESPLLKKNFEARPLKPFLHYANENYKQYCKRKQSSENSILTSTEPQQNHLGFNYNDSKECIKGKINY